MHKAMLAWLGGVIVSAGIFAVWVIERAEEKAEIPVMSMELKVAGAVEAAKKAETDVTALRAETKADIAALKVEIGEVRNAVGDSEKTIGAKIDTLTNNFNTYITNQATKTK